MVGYIGCLNDLLQVMSLRLPARPTKYGRFTSKGPSLSFSQVAIDDSYVPFQYTE